MGEGDGGLLLMSDGREDRDVKVTFTILGLDGVDQGLDLRVGRCRLKIMRTGT